MNTILLLLCLAVPDETLRAVKDRPVRILLRNGADLQARVLAFDADRLTFVISLSGTVVTIDRAEVTEIRLLPQSPTLPAAESPPPERDRHFGFQVSEAAGLMLDLDYGRFYGFAHVPVAFPAASGGNIVGFSVGAGVALPVARSSRWKVELFAFVSPLRLAIDSPEDNPSTNNWTAALGVGVGMHYTFASGFSLGFRSPVLGYATGMTGGAVDGFAVFYLASAIGLPILSMGYRF